MSNLIWAVAVLLIVLWALGLATSYTMGGLVHVLLVLALVAIVARLFAFPRSSP